VLTSLECSEADSNELLALLLKLHNSAAAQLGAAPRHFMAAADLYSATISSKREQLLQQQQFLKVYGFKGCAYMCWSLGCHTLLSASLPACCASFLTYAS
jgi:hypothetical protein